MKQHSHKTLIIDDEPDAREVLHSMLVRYCPNLTICGEADSVEGALQAIQFHQPNLVFLDIDLHPGSGFDILDAFPNPNFKTVFTTAHDDFALKAYQYRAMHYLLKPIDPGDLIQVTREMFSDTSTSDFKISPQPITPQGNLVLPTSQGVILLKPEEISYAYTDDKYTQVILNSGEKVFVSHTLKNLEALLPFNEFFRPHQSFLIRIESVRKIQKGLGGLSLILKDKSEIPISRRNKEAVLKILGIVI